MALRFPLIATDFFTLLPVQKMSFWLGEASQVSRTGAGEVIVASHGARLWRGTVQLHRRGHVETEQILPIIYALQDARAKFHATPIQRQRPLLIPSTNTCTLQAVQNGREIQLSGLPAGAVLSIGDFLSWPYSGRQTLHQVVETITADGSGVTGWVEVTPSFSPLVTSGVTVRLNRPICMARMVPGTFNPAQLQRVNAEGIQFDWIQTLR